MQKSLKGKGEEGEKRTEKDAYRGKKDAELELVTLSSEFSCLMEN